MRSPREGDQRIVDAAFDFDPELAHLPLAFDLEAVSRLFQERWAGVEARPRMTCVTARKLLDTKYEPRTSCVTTYDLEVATQDGRRSPTIGALHIRPAETVLLTFERDPDLPWIASAIDGDAMTQRFTASLPDLTRELDGGLEIRAIRYKPGARCVLRYSLGRSSRPRVVFGKIIRSESAQLASALAALQDASSGNREMPRIAGPLTYWPDLRMLVQSAVEGAELHDVAFDAALELEAREQWMEKAGRGLAGLHSATSVQAPVRTMSDDADELEGYTAPMAQAAPQLAHSFVSALELLRKEAARAGSDFVASHGAFRTDQFMIQHGDLVMIDLDTFCWAHPERDVGNFLAYLQWKAMRQPQHASFLERAPQRFLDGYAVVRPALDEGRVALYHAASLLKIAGRRFRSLTVREWPLVPELIDSAHRHLIA
jgi:hypothetical protein